MGITNFKASLEKRYAVLTGELQATHANIARIKREVSKLGELEARIVELEALIAGAAMLLRDAHPDWTPEATEPIEPWTHKLPVPFGTCGRRGMEVLRKADRPMTVREVTLEVLRSVGCEEPDKETLQRAFNAIEASFRKHRGDTLESSGKYPAQWRTIAKNGLEFDI